MLSCKLLSSPRMYCAGRCAGVLGASLVLSGPCVSLPGQSQCWVTKEQSVASWLEESLAQPFGVCSSAIQFDNLICTMCRC
jgi:hypothetical protein